MCRACPYIIIVVVFFFFSSLSLTFCLSFFSVCVVLLSLHYSAVFCFVLFVHRACPDIIATFSRFLLLLLLLLLQLFFCTPCLSLHYCAFFLLPLLSLSLYTDPSSLYIIVLGVHCACPDVKMHGVFCTLYLSRHEMRGVSCAL